jgi:HD-GYP domain-containing protein (c-di-GMP phosphodiesterase class II)
MQTDSVVEPAKPLAQPGGALAALEITRVALLHGLEAVHEQILSQGTENQVLRRELEAARTRHVDLETNCGHHESEVARLRFELQKREFDVEQGGARLVEAQRERDEAREENADFNARIASAGRALEEAGARNSGLNARIVGLEAQVEHLSVHKNNLEEHKSHLEEKIADSGAHIENLQGQVEQLHDHKSDLEEKLEQLDQKNADMHRELVALYTDLRGEGLPQLVLKLAAGLTGAESGLFTEADGDGTLAELRVSEMEEMIVGALYDYSRRAADSNEPLVENNPKKLPDGAGLVNLAALPVAAKGKKRGVLLLCNKRGGPFTEDDTRVLLAIGQHAGLAMENARLHEELSEAYAATIAVLADAIEAKDAYTRGHCEGVSRLAVEVGRRLELSDEQLEQVRYAALLHDVGKIGVPDGILLKPSKLMPEEFSIIQKHPQIGRDIVARIGALSALSEVILHHHEKWDGSGYPQGLAGEGIPLLARIVCAVDAFDAMTTPRPYRTAVDNAEAIAEMRRCSGTQFDAQIVEHVADIICAI